MPIRNDAAIPDGAILWRVLIEKWVTTKQGRTRPTSDSFLDSTRENSCFISGGCTLEERRRLFPEAHRFAQFPASILRENGFGLERRPLECPPDYPGDPADHLVVGPTEEITWNEYVRRAKRIVTHPDMAVGPEL